jgi:hypothetical protein
VETIEEELKREHVITLLEQVKSRGALNLLRASVDNLEAYRYKYRNNQKFFSDLVYLRSEGLVSFPYTDIDQSSITLLGQTVLRANDELSAVFSRVAFSNQQAVRSAVSSRTNHPEISRSTSSDYNITLADNCGIIDTDVIPELPADIIGSDGYEVEISSNIQFYKWDLKEEGQYRISLSVADQSNIAGIVDPFLELYIYDEKCELIERDDDTGESLNSQILRRLRAGSYVLGPFSLAASGTATIKIE